MDKALIPFAGWEVGGELGPCKFYVKGGKALDDVINPVNISPVVVAPAVLLGGH